MLRPWLLFADSLSSSNSLHHTLTWLNLGGDGGFDMTLLLEVLVRCVNLRDLGMYGVTTDGLELKTSPPWVCKLWRLILSIESYGGCPVLTKFALSFMEQLGLQTGLTPLDLRSDDGDNELIGDSPYLQLILDPKRGLG